MMIGTNLSVSNIAYVAEKMRQHDIKLKWGIGVSHPNCILKSDVEMCTGGGEPARGAAYLHLCSLPTNNNAAPSLQSAAQGGTKSLWLAAVT